MRRFPAARHPLIALLTLLLLSLPARSAEELSTEQTRELSMHMLRMHLTQHALDQTFMKRMVKEFLKRLDPSRTIYLQSEVDEKLKQSEEDLTALAKKLQDGDLTFFSNWIKEFKDKHLARDNEFFAKLEEHQAEIKIKITREELDKLKPDTYAQSEDERRKRMLLLARSNYEFFKTYQPEDDAFKLALQTVTRLRKERGEIDADRDTPKETMKAFMSALDPHSEYMDAEETEEFRTSMARSFSGIGVQIRACLLGAQVVDVIKDRPAFKSNKFAVDDQIIAVDNHPLAGLTIDHVVKRIKGEKGTKVKITLLKAGKEGPESKQDVELVRDTIELADIKVQGKKFNTAAGSVGYIGVENFYEGVSGDVAERIRELGKDEPLAGLVLDLRNNGGGYLDEAIKLTGLFISKGPVVAERGSNKRVVWRYDPDPATVWSGPLVVLVNQFSASASEIVAGALKDYGRGVVVGPSQTHGKGTVQKIVDLAVVPMPGAIRITVQQYFIAGGDSVQLQGVLPDIKLPGRKLVEDFLEKAQDGALPWSKVDSVLEETQPDVALHKPWKGQVLAALKEKSQTRVATNKEFDIYKDLDADKPATSSGEATPEPEKPRKPGEKKDLKDPQRDEAVQIASDMAALWPKPDAVAKQEPVEEKQPAVK